MCEQSLHVYCAPLSASGRSMHVAALQTLSAQQPFTTWPRESSASLCRRTNRDGCVEHVGVHGCVPFSIFDECAIDECVIGDGQRLSLFGFAPDPKDSEPFKLCQFAHRFAVPLVHEPLG